MGEWCIVLDKLHLITKIFGQAVIEVVPEPLIYDRLLEKSDAIPILQWEEIEIILEKAGYSLVGLDRSENRPFHCDIMQGNDLITATIAKSRQEAVMLAVEALGKELK